MLVTRQESTTQIILQSSSSYSIQVSSECFMSPVGARSNIHNLMAQGHTGCPGRQTRKNEKEQKRLALIYLNEFYMLLLRFYFIVGDLFHRHKAVRSLSISARIPHGKIANWWRLSWAIECSSSIAIQAYMSIFLACPIARLSVITSHTAEGVVVL